MMPQDKKVVIFCSSSYDIDPKYNEAARKVVDAVCALGYTVVSGGAVKGTMGAVAAEVAKCGGRQIGVLPRFMKDLKNPAVDEVIWTDTMAERKTKMREGTVAAIALPGGIGTMDEFFETMVLAKLGKYSGRLYALNLDGFYDALKSLLDQFVKTKMMKESEEGLVLFPDTPEELKDMMY